MVNIIGRNINEFWTNQTRIENDYLERYTADQKLKKYNNKGMQHQEGLSECGMYVLYFIIHLLEKTKTVDDFRKKRIPDEEISSFRTIYFNKI
jgi:hypothetical protein